MLTWIRGHSADVVDVFVYIVVLNLAIEYVPSVISESFSLSILTALLLKITLEVVIAAKTFVMTRLKGAALTRQRTLWAVALWVLADSVWVWGLLIMALLGKLGAFMVGLVTS